MKLMEAGRSVAGHRAYRSDAVREEDGLRAELSPPAKPARPLEDKIIGPKGRDTEEDMQMLLTGGTM